MVWLFPAAGQTQETRAPAPVISARSRASICLGERLEVGHVRSALLKQEGHVQISSSYKAACTWHFVHIHVTPHCLEVTQTPQVTGSVPQDHPQR